MGRKHGVKTKGGSCLIIKVAQTKGHESSNLLPNYVRLYARKVRMVTAIMPGLSGQMVGKDLVCNRLNEQNKPSSF